MRTLARLLCGASLVWLGAASAAAAQQTGGGQPDPAKAEPSAQIDEIIVTAQKRSERLSDVPLSITAATGQALQRAGVTDTSQLEKIVPGFTFQKSSYGAPVFTMRGIGFYDTSVGVSPAVSVYLDQAPLPYSVMARGVTLDLERLEALKGPQGTLFGQNSTGGAVNYIAAKPTQALHAGVDVTAGRFGQLEGQGFISGGITPNLAGRLAVRVESRDDWQKGYAPNDNKFGKAPGATLGERHFATTRGMLDWNPTEKSSFSLNVNGWKDTSDTQAAQFIRFAPQSPLAPFNAVTYNAFVNSAPALVKLPDDARVAGWDAGRDFARDDWFYQVALRGQINLNDWLTLNSISTYNKYKQDAVVDTDGTAYADQVVDQNARIKSVSQELRLSADLGRFKWMLGANYAEDTSNERQQNVLGSTNNGVGPFRYDRVEFRNRQESKTWAAFGGIDFNITETVTVQGSVRYTKQDRDFAGCAADPGTDGRFALAFRNAFGTNTTPGKCVTMSDPVTRTLLPIVNSELNQDNLSWRTGISWKPSTDSLIYANVTKGYKAGSFPVLPGAFAFQFDPVTQESVLAYETGFKVSTMNRRVDVSGSVFYYDYKNKQILGTVLVAPFGNLPKLVNIPESRVQGAELQILARPIDGLRISAGGTYVDSEVRRDPPNAIDQFGIATSFVGEPFPNTPKWQFTGDIEYRKPVAGMGNAYIGAGVTSRSNSQAAFGESPEFAIRHYALLDLRAGLDLDNGVTLQVWGRNVTDKFYVNNVSHLIDVVARTTGMPATYGVTVGYRF